MSIRYHAVRRQVRVAFVEQHAMIGESFAIAVRHVCVPCPVVVAGGTSASEITAAVLAVRPAIAVLHLGMAISDRDLPIEQLTRAQVVTTVLSDAYDDARLGDFIARGADAALSTANGLRGLVDVLERVGRRQPAMEATDLARLRAARVGSRAGTALGQMDRLSIRESQVLRLLMAGIPPAQIARRGHVSEATVRSQVRSILAKLEVSSQLAAVARAYGAGWAPTMVESVCSSG